MATPQLLNDIINVLLMLAPAAAVVCLVLAGISLRKEGGGITFVLGGGFSKWMFWCVVFLTLQPLLVWFRSFGLAVPLPGGGITTSWLALLESDMTSFVNNFILRRLVTTLAAFMVLRAILDAASGEPFLPSLIAALFLLGAQTTLTLLSNWNSGTQYATVDVLNSAWNYLAGTIMPIRDRDPKWSGDQFLALLRGVFAICYFGQRSVGSVPRRIGGPTSGVFSPPAPRKQ